MSKSDGWCSPPEIADGLEEFFEGPVDVDPCSNSRSIIRAMVAYTMGGLVLPWRRPGKTKRTAYENFPYSKGGVWTTKALAELACGNVRELVRLSMFATSTQWWSDQCRYPQRNPRILGLKRLMFIDPRPDKDPMTCRFEPALTYFGPRVRRFEKTFSHLTMWTTWGRT